MDRLTVVSLVNKLGLKMHHITDQQETLYFVIEWIADKAKNQDEAAKTLFNTIFRLSPLMEKIVTPWLKFSIRIWGFLVTHLGELKARYTSTAALLVSGITFMASLAWFIINFLERIHPYVSTYTLMVMSVLTSILSSFFLLGQRSSRSATEHPRILLATTFILMSTISSIDYIFLVMGLVERPAIDFPSPLIYTLMATASLILFETARQVLGFIPRERMEWFFLEFWYTSCLLARLDRQAMTKVIGEKALRWLEDERARRLAEQSPHTS
jgi:hypothetical protein